jgi:hypothetical protein
VIIESEQKDYVILDDSIAAFLNRGSDINKGARVLFNDAGETPRTEAAESSPVPAEPPKPRSRSRKAS